jgi:Putative adhesin
MGSSESESIIEQQFPVGEGPGVSLDTVSGRVTIRASEERFIRVRARKYGRPEAVGNTDIEFSSEGDLLTVRTKGRSGGILGGDGVCSVDFDLSVPRGCRIHVHTVSASVDIRAVGGAVDIHTVSGSVFLDEATDSSSIHTVSGSCNGHSLEGELRLNTVSGSAAISSSHLHVFELESVSGSITLETALALSGRYRAKTVSGAVRLQVPDDTGITVHLGSVSGRIHSELPSALEKVGFGGWHGEINGGGAELHVNSVSGSVTITGAGAPVPA